MRRNPPGVYNNTEHVKQFYKGYEEAGGMVAVIEDAHRILRDLILKAGVVRYWWNGREILHPKTPDWLNDILTGLAQLSQISNQQSAIS